nr:amino acid ABC transporter permease [Leptolyngbya sp. FACHB-321]
MRKRILTALISGRSRWAIVALQTFLVIVFVSSLVAQPLLPSIAQDKPTLSIERAAASPSDANQGAVQQGAIVAQAPATPSAAPAKRGFDLDFRRIVPDIPFILAGIPVTLIFTLSSVFLGLIWGSVLSLCKISGIKPLQWLSFAYTTIFRGTPLLLQLSLVYFATPQLTGYNITPYQAGVLTFTLNSGAYMSETIRAGIQAVDKGQAEASLSLGIPYWLMMWDVIMPQALKNILPALVNETISLLKDSALVSTIGVVEILRAAQIVGANKYIYFEPLLFAGLIYYVLVMGLTYAASTLERRLRRSE